MCRKSFQSCFLRFNFDYIYFLGFLQEDQKKSDALKRDMTRLDEVKTEMNNAVHHAGQGHPKTLWSKFYLKDRKTW